jgi:hypothetical protein
MAISPSGAVILALDPSNVETPGLHVLSADGTIPTKPTLFGEDGVAGEVLEMLPDDVKQLLYNTEQLRKMRYEDEGDDEEPLDLPTPAS